MGCCGHKRAELTNRTMSTPARSSVIPKPRPAELAPSSLDTGHKPRTAPSSTSSAGIATVALRYLAGSPLRLHGSVTMRAYEFSAGQPVQAVAASDAMELLASRLFRRA
jgi:hypothetical protein